MSSATPIVPDLDAARAVHLQRTTVPTETGFGDRLKRSRNAAGLYQRELAAMIGVDVSHITKLESGAIQRPTLHTIHRLASALKVEAVWLRGYPSPDDYA